MSGSLTKTLVTIAIVIILLFAGYSFLTMPDQRTTGQRIGDSIDALPKGVDKAAEQFEKRTPGEKLGDDVKDAGDNIKKNTGNQ